jgi:GMP synthase (glutamine-hydrolysing)
MNAPSATIAPDRRPRFEVRERLRILFVNPLERHLVDVMQVAPYEQWVASVAQVAADRLEVVNVADGQRLPDTIEAHGIIGGGSEHSAFEQLTWIKEIKEFYAAARAQGIPQLHFCWSHQAMAMAEGGQVERGPRGRRFGIEELTLTPEGRRDPIFTGLPDRFPMMTSHTDVVTALPPAPLEPAVELARGAVYEREALAYGGGVRTFQVHPELTADFLESLARVRRRRLVDEGLVGASDAEFHAYVARLRAADGEIRGNALRIVDNWVTHFAGGRRLSTAPGAE